MYIEDIRYETVLHEETSVFAPYLRSYTAEHPAIKIIMYKLK